MQMQMRACGIFSSRSYSPQPPTSDGEGDMRGGLQIGFFAIVTRPSCSPFNLPEPDGDPDGDPGEEAAPTGGSANG